MKKLFLLGVVPEVPENYTNVKMIMSSLNLEVIEFSAAADIKMCKYTPPNIKGRFKTKPLKVWIIKNFPSFTRLFYLLFPKTLFIFTVMILTGKSGGKPKYGCPFCSASTPYLANEELYCLGDLLELHKVKLIFKNLSNYIFI